jgi:hypothetical protein
MPAGESWLALSFPRQRLLLETIRECYEVRLTHHTADALGD